MEWLDRREAAPDTPPVKPQSPRQPIYLNLKRKASEESEPEVTTFLLSRAAEPQDEDFMRNKAAPVFHNSNHVLVPCEFRHKARVCPKQNCWSAFTGWGTTSTRAKVALGWRGAPRGPSSVS